jgi:hypothetical protein
VLLTAVLGVAGGWFMREQLGPALDDSSIGFVSLAGVSRGGECTIARLAPGTRIVAVRIPGATAQAQLLAARADGTPLAASDYSVRMQADRSWLLRISGSALLGQEVELESREGSARDPVGCISGITTP